MNASNFLDNGFVVIREMFTGEDATRTMHAILQAAQMTLADFQLVVDGLVKPFYRHGVIADTEALWPLFVHERIVSEVSETLAASCKCLAGIDTVGVHYSETDPHRDVSTAQLPCLRDRPDDPDYDVVRVITYPGPTPGQFGVLPRSHRIAGRPRDLLEFRSQDWCWLTVGPRDAILFDPRLIHAGGRMLGPRLMAVLTYGGGAIGSIETYLHARIGTHGLRFPDPTPDLVRLLRNHGLFLEETFDRAAWDRYRQVWAPPETG